MPPSADQLAYIAEFVRELSKIKGKYSKFNEDFMSDIAEGIDASFSITTIDGVRCDIINAHTDKPYLRVDRKTWGVMPKGYLEKIAKAEDEHMTSYLVGDEWSAGDNPDTVGYLHIPMFPEGEPPLTIEDFLSGPVFHASRAGKIAITGERQYLEEIATISKTVLEQLE